MTAHSEPWKRTPDSKEPEALASAEDKSRDKPPTEEVSDLEPETADASDIAAQLHRLGDSVNSLHQVMNERLRYDDAKEAAFNRLYKDLDEQRRQSSGEPLRPILRDLVMLHDHIVECARQHPHAAEALETIRESLFEVLYRADVEPIECGENRYDRSLQQVKRVEKTADPAMDWMVVEVLRQGFCCGERVLRPQQVVVRRYENAGPEKEMSNE